MRGRIPSVTTAALSAAIAALIASVPMAGQTQRPAAPTQKALPRTPDGHVDLQGTYDIATLTPIERPNSANGRLTMTEQDAARLERGEATRVADRAAPSPVDRAAPTVGAPVGGYNNFWIDRGDTVIRVDDTPRTSLIIDPPDGKIPALTDEARRRIRRRSATAPTPTPTTKTPR